MVYLKKAYAIKETATLRLLVPGGGGYKKAHCNTRDQQSGEKKPPHLSPKVAETMKVLQSLFDSSQIKTLNLYCKFDQIVKWHIGNTGCRGLLLEKSEYESAAGRIDFMCRDAKGLAVGLELKYPSDATSGATDISTQK